jgi:hypothetical protein
MPSWQTDNVKNLMSGIGDLYASGGPRYFEGPNYTTPNANQILGRNMMTGYATGVGQELVNNAQAANNYWMDPANLFSFQNAPGYQGVRQGITQDVTRNLTENILPQTRGSAITGGGLGGSRQQQAEALATGRTSGEIAKALSGLDLGMYGQNLQANQSAIARAPEMYALGAAPGDLVQRVGSAERSDTAEQIAGDMARWNFDENKQANLLALIKALTGSAGEYGGTVKGKQTTQMSGGNGWMQGLGALMSLGGMAMGMPGVGAALGGAAGGIGGAGTGGAVSWGA